MRPTDRPSRLKKMISSALSGKATTTISSSTPPTGSPTPTPSVTPTKTPTSTPAVTPSVTPTKTPAVLPSGIWTQLGQDIDGEVTGDQSGYSVSFNNNGDIVAIGAIYNDANTGNTNDNRGHVRIYQWNGTAWTQLGQDINGEAAGDFSSRSISINAAGDRIAIGADWNSPNGLYSGHVRVYSYNGTAWTQLGQDINGTAVRDYFGCSVSLNAAGNILAAGATTSELGAQRGYARIYQWNGTSWIKIGGDITGEVDGDTLGISISLDSIGTRVAIGVYGASSSRGAVRVYDWNGTSWIKIGGDIIGEAVYDYSSISIFLNAAGNRVVIGARLNDGNGSAAGHARVYSFNGTAWTQLGQDIDGEAAGDYNGKSVAINNNGDIVAIGATYNDANTGNTNDNRGHARVYSFNGTAWTQLGQDIDGEAAGDQSGYSVSLNSAGDKVAIGAIYNDGNGLSSGHVRVYQIGTLVAETPTPTPTGTPVETPTPTPTPTGTPVETPTPTPTGTPQTVVETSQVNNIVYGLDSLNPDSVNGPGILVAESLENELLKTDNKDATTATPVLAAGTGDWQGVAVSRNGQHVILTERDGFLRVSNDGMNTFTPKVTDTNRSWAQARASRTGQYMHVACRRSGIWTSNDYGITWNNNLVLSEIENFLASSANGEIVYTVTYTEGSNLALYKSTDFGATWSVVNNNCPHLQICCDESGNNVYVGPTVDYDQGTAVYKSTDGGLTFNLIYTSPSADQKYISHTDCSSDGNLVAFCREDDITEYPRGAADIVLSYDGGTTWQSPIVMPGNVTDVNIVRVCPYTRRIMVGSWDGGLYVCDYGETALTEIRRPLY